MKSFYEFISVFMTALFCILCVTGCSVIQERDPLTANPKTEMKTAAPLTPKPTVDSETDSMYYSNPITEDYYDSDYQDPPEIMIFHSWDEYGVFRSISEKSDSEIATSMKEEFPYLYSYGINTKKDVEKYKDTIDSLYIIKPRNDMFKLRVIYYYIDYEYLFISYSDGNASSYDNLFYYTAWHKSNETQSREYDLQVKIDDCSIYRYKDNNEYFWGEINRLTEVGIRYCGKNLKNAPEMLQNCFEIIRISDIFQDK